LQGSYTICASRVLLNAGNTTRGFCLQHEIWLVELLRCRRTIQAERSDLNELVLDPKITKQRVENDFVHALRICHSAGGLASFAVLQACLWLKNDEQLTHDNTIFTERLTVIATFGNWETVMIA